MENHGRLIGVVAGPALGCATLAAPMADGPAGALSGAPQAQAQDRFGVREIYPTAADGREWTLPDDADTTSVEWNVEGAPVTRVGDGVFHTAGEDGQVRLSVGSPRGAAWWRDVEMTGYFRYTAAHDSNDQVRHWELLVRGERHDEGTVSGGSINDGVTAPAGTSTWPGYPFSGRVPAACLGSTYHGNFSPDGTGLFEKELSHIAGYGGNGPRAMPTGSAIRPAAGSG